MQDIRQHRLRSCDPFPRTMHITSGLDKVHHNPGSWLGTVASPSWQRSCILATSYEALSLRRIPSSRFLSSSSRLAVMAHIASWLTPLHALRLQNDAAIELSSSATYQPYTTCRPHVSAHQLGTRSTSCALSRDEFQVRADLTSSRVVGKIRAEPANYSRNLPCGHMS